MCVVMAQYFFSPKKLATIAGDENTYILYEERDLRASQNNGTNSLFLSLRAIDSLLKRAHLQSHVEWQLPKPAEAQSYQLAKQRKN